MDLQTAVAVSMLGASRTRASAVFKELRLRDPHASLMCLLRTLGVPPDTQRGLADAARSAAAAALAAGAGAGMEPIAWFDPRYPALLNCVPDPPPVLWARGMAAVLARPAVAIVGSRAATPYALDVAARLAGELAERGIVVVSGLARGVDSAAHRGCLAAGGPTVAVLGSGVDTSIHRSTSRWLKPLHPMGLWSVSSALAAGPSRSTFRSGTGSSAGSRWPLSSSKHPRRAAPS